MMNKKSFMKLFIKKLYWIIPIWYGLTMKVSRLLLRSWKIKFPTFRTPNEIHLRMNFDNHYRLDPIKEKLDVLSHPTLIEKRIRSGKPVGDCDDHAIYWATALLKSGHAKNVWFSSVLYAYKKSSIRGHVRCIWKDYNDQLWWADYNFPKKINSLEKDDWIQDYLDNKDIQVIGTIMIPVVDVIKRTDTPKFDRKNILKKVYI